MCVHVRTQPPCPLEFASRDFRLGVAQGEIFLNLYYWEQFLSSCLDWFSKLYKTRS